MEHISNDNVDNSFIVILWKMGLVGLGLYILILFHFFHRGLYLFKHSKDISTQRFIAALLSGFAGLIFIALTNSCLAFYRFNIIWALSFASIEIYYQIEKQ